MNLLLRDISRLCSDFELCLCGIIEQSSSASWSNQSEQSLDSPRPMRGDQPADSRSLSCLPVCPPRFLSSQVCLPSYKSVLSPAEINWKINERKTLTELKYFIPSKIIYLSVYFNVSQELLYQMHPMITF